MTQNLARRLDTFQMKGLRKILGIPPTYIHRSTSNQDIFNILRHQHDVHILPLSQVLTRRKVTLLGHIIRTDRSDPMHQVTFRDENLSPFHPIVRRPGRPRHKWIDEQLQNAWNLYDDGGQEFTGTPEQNTKLKQAALPNNNNNTKQ